MLFPSLIVAIACGTALVGAWDSLPEDDEDTVGRAAKNVVKYINDETGSTCVLKTVKSAEAENLDKPIADLRLVIIVTCNVGGETKEVTCSPVLDYIPAEMDSKVGKTGCDDPKLNNYSS